MSGHFWANVNKAFTRIRVETCYGVPVTETRLAKGSYYTSKVNTSRADFSQQCEHTDYWEYPRALEQADEQPSKKQSATSQRQLANGSRQPTAGNRQPATGKRSMCIESLASCERPTDLRP
ncbi:unnamed protein product [Ceratitis capitata]|uniref:(Mediterranean fruit fly) hypothetical protein n=1 Tax=Ceratitis capitata TaxID=7213 RepID=A0A811V4M2_CERCA|nr:unnamed protein product [Ceratitis capitata]